MGRVLFAVVAVVGFAAGSSTHRALLAQQQAPCVDRSNDPAGCQPSTFDTPMAQMPSVRVNRQGQVDPTSSEADAKAGRVRPGEAPPSLPKLRAPALGGHRALREESRNRGLARRRPGRRGRRPRAWHRRQLHLRRSRERRRRSARHQHLQDSAEPRAPATGAGGRDPGHGRRQRRLRRSRAARARVSHLRGPGPLHHGPQRRHQHPRPDGDLSDRPEHVPADPQERGVGLPRAVARVLPLARSREREPHPRLHDELDGRRARSGEPWPQGSRSHGTGGHRRGDRRDAAQAEAAGGFHAAGSGWPADRRTARRHRPLLRRPLRGLQRLEERARPGGQLPEPRAEPAALGVGDRRRRTRLRGRHDGRLLRPQLRGRCPRARSGAGGGHGRLQPPLDHRVGWRRDRRRRSCPRWPTTACTWWSTTIPA